ncbi:Transcriptional regulator, IclR family (plasmid) [Roseomonas mucosa]|uniref:Transcriptional regulator, IclR family n=1 Tax=Roseomonas mucosa TaxID=207340 RepID=A0A4Y1MRA1_9PROT|nr:IclR family transcriptional regulator C-terminal domain-containing protein [Roseomonas mucosa]AWV20487.1 Transcriptional regulator, IclR family [Roseomonas mucosa]MDT8275739.1 IclR family transcriptional regulator C-terminal domain-containing protein [Roseomonas mucosa]MDT8356152.1 IclR family transcriptional regulator C-terminal domain-containing protein [Roseomonas mucosa]MDU7523607.1 IclR family transcriptional regulator C-terminal domain-containing protein [Roseomonas mucosa]
MPTTVPATLRTLAIFETFARERRELSNAEVARLIGLPESSTSDLLHTLHEAGYLLRTVRTRRFYPTRRLLDLARQASEKDPLAAFAAEAVAALSERTGETAIAGRPDGMRVQVVGVQPGSHPLRYMLAPGERLAMHASALGKALLALLPPDEMRRAIRARPLRPVGPSSITDPDRLEAAIEEVRARGWAWVADEAGEGVAALAIAGLVGDEPLAVSLAGPASRLRNSRGSYLAALAEVRPLIFGDLARS